MVSIEQVGDIRCTVGESPLWHAAQAAWYWVDIVAKRIWRLDHASGATRSWQTEEQVACLAVRADGGFIAGMESGIFALELDEDGVRARKLGAPAEGELVAGMRFNDGRCDRQGRFWSGTMEMSGKPVGQLYRCDAQAGLTGPYVSELVTQNGLAFSPDGATMYLSDSHPSRRMVWVYDYDIAAGTPHNRRVFADMRDLKGRPDGAAIDTDGCYWICGNDGGVLLRYTPAGVLDREIRVPMAKPSMCSFGGPDLDTLLVASISAGAPEGDTEAGAVVLVRPGVRGVAETPYAL
ncbi:MAG TPA: SMP-30/gluconolactonase/LRE family protein [Burkholderiaceae bacterium]